MTKRNPPSSSRYPNAFVVLCAESHPVNQLILASQLESLGYAYEMVNNGQDALAKWQSHRFSLVITNCSLPQMDGFELTDAIREQEDHQQRPPTTIIATTTNALDENRQYCIASGMDHCLTKPFQVQALGSILRRFAQPILPAPQEPPNPVIINQYAFSGINSHHLVQVIGSPNPQLLNSVLAQFVQHSRHDVHMIRQAIEVCEPDHIGECAHAIASAAASLGAFELSARFKQIKANADDFTYVRAQLKVIELQLHHLNGTLTMSRNAQ